MKITGVEEYEKVKDTIILEGIIGSQSHGTYHPEHPDSIDDVDIMGITIPGIEHYLGLKSFGSRGTKVIQEGKFDIVLYGIKKYVSLLLKCNPNVTALLWLNKEHYTKITDIGKLLIDNRDVFTSKLMYKSFTGYAYSQLKRMTHLACEGYMGEKRKNLVKKYGYDCKNSSHCIRLLKMGIEYLTTGELLVFRHDRQMLTDIKYGKWSLEKVKKEADRLFILAEEALIKSDLPKEPDYKKAEELLITILLRKLRLKEIK